MFLIDKIRTSRVVRSVAFALALASPTCSAGGRNSNNGYCINGECVVTVNHQGLVELVYGNEDRDRNGILDIDDWAHNISKGCIKNVRTGNCDRFNDKRWVNGQKEFLDVINKDEYNGLNNTILTYYLSGKTATTKDIPDQNMDSLVQLALLY